MTEDDFRREMELLRYELSQAQNRPGWKYAPGGDADPVNPAIVTVEIPPGPGDGSFVFGGKAKLITDNIGTQGDEVNVWNKYQARIPVDVVIDIDRLPPSFDLPDDYQLIAADCDPQGPELQEAQSTTSSAISDISYTPITPTQTISRPGIYDFRYGVTIDATIPNNATLGYQLQLWDVTNSQELGNTGPIFQTRSASGVVSDNGSFYSDLDALTTDVDVQLRATNVGDGSLDSTIGDFLQTFGPL